MKTRSYNLGRFDTDEIGESLGETGRPLLSPDEVRMMKKDEQLLFIQALPPIRAERFPFWFVGPWASWAQRNPVEGDYPQPRPRLHLTYKQKEKING